MNTKKRNKFGMSGFTLIEIMIVIAIIGILAAIAIPSYLNHVQRTHRKAAVADIMTLQQKMESQYILNNGQYTAVPIENGKDVCGTDIRYSFAIALGVSNLSYTITATQCPSQVGEECGSLRVTHDDRHMVNKNGGTWVVDSSCF